MKWSRQDYLCISVLNPVDSTFRVIRESIETFSFLGCFTILAWSHRGKKTRSVPNRQNVALSSNSTPQGLFGWIRLASGPGPGLGPGVSDFCRHWRPHHGARFVLQSQARSPGRSEGRCVGIASGGEIAWGCCESSFRCLLQSIFDMRMHVENDSGMPSI